jgi:hypothetical protein
MTSVSVQCCWAVGGAPHLVRFQLNGIDHLVEEVLDQWSGADCSFVKLRADDGNLYVLRHDGSGSTESWALTSFRKDPGSYKSS